MERVQQQPSEYNVKFAGVYDLSPDQYATLYALLDLVRSSSRSSVTINEVAERVAPRIRSQDVPTHVAFLEGRHLIRKTLRDGQAYYSLASPKEIRGATTLIDRAMGFKDDLINNALWQEMGFESFASDDGLGKFMDTLEAGFAELVTSPASIINPRTVRIDLVKWGLSSITNNSDYRDSLKKVAQTGLGLNFFLTDPRKKDSPKLSIPSIKHLGEIAEAATGGNVKFYFYSPNDWEYLRRLKVGLMQFNKVADGSTAKVFYTHFALKDKKDANKYAGYVARDEVIGALLWSWLKRLQDKSDEFIPSDGIVELKKAAQ